MIGVGVAAVAAIGLVLGYQQLQTTEGPTSAAASTTQSSSASPAADGSPTDGARPSVAARSSAATVGQAPSARTSQSAPASPSAPAGPSKSASATSAGGASTDTTVMADTTGPVYGDTANGLVTYTVEVMPALRDQLQPLLAVTDEVFGDGARGWTARGGRALQRVAEPDQAQIRIILASPQQVDDYCGDAGLDTSGLYSCWDGAHTMLNSDRWFHATAEFTDLAVYREYLVNHEFGHGLGYDHEYCPGPDEVAPVMQQQSISLQGCRSNGWPYPA